MKKLYGILLLGAILTTGFASNALALTAACSTITNQATLTYSVGGVAQANILSDGDAIAPGVQTTDFTVDSKVDLTVSTFNSPVTATGINQVLVYRITNAGNDTQRYMLQLYAGNGEVRGPATDNFDMTNVRVVVDTSPDGAISVNPDGTINLGAGESVISLAALTDGSDLILTPDVTGNVGAVPANVIEVYVISNVPGGRATGDDALYTLKARSYQVAGVAGVGGVFGGETGNTSGGGLTVNSCGSAVVLADVTAALNGVGLVTDGINDGDSYATGYYTVSAATISVAKTQTILWDPINLAVAPQAIPGAYVQYVITVSNTGAAAATLNTITDGLAAQLAIDPDLITNAAIPESLAGSGFKVVVIGSTRALNAANQYFTTTSSADGVDFAAPTVTADFGVILPVEAGPGYTAGELKAGESVALTFNAIIL